MEDKRPSGTAMLALPGIPRPSVGRNAVPSLASLLASLAMTPRTSPVPNFSPSPDVCAAWK